MIKGNCGVIVYGVHYYENYARCEVIFKRNYTNENSKKKDLKDNGLRAVESEDYFSLFLFVIFARTVQFFSKTISQCVPLRLFYLDF